MNVIKEFFFRLGVQLDKESLAQAEGALKAGIGGALKWVSGIALAGTAALGYFVKETAHHGAEINKLSQIMGVSTDTAQEWSYATQRAGVDLVTLERGSERLSANILESGRATGLAAEAFEDLGIKTRDAKGQVRPTEDVMMDLADAMANMSDSGTKTARVQQLLGKGGITLLPLLNKGSAAFKELGQEARDLGLILDKDSIQRSAELSRQFGTLSAVAGALEQRIASGIIPTVLEMVHGFLSWWKVNGALVKQRLDKVFRALLAVLKPIGAAVLFLGKVLGFLIDNLGTVASVLMGVLLAALVLNAGALATLTGAFISTGIAAVAAAVRSALAWAAAAAPVIALASLFALLILLIQDLYTWWEGGDSLLGRLWAKWKDVIHEFEKPHAGDPWWLAALRTAVRLVEDLFKELSDLPNAAADAYRASKAALTGGKYLSVEDEQALKQYEESKAKGQNWVSVGSAAESKTLAGMAALSTPGGNLASLQAQGASVYPSSTSQTNHTSNDNRVITNNNSVSVDGSKSPEETVKAVSDWFTGQLSAAKGTR